MRPSSPFWSRPKESCRCRKPVSRGFLDGFEVIRCCRECLSVCLMTSPLPHPPPPPFPSLNRLVPRSTLICRTERGGRRGRRIRRGNPLHPRASSQRDGGPTDCTGAPPQGLIFVFLLSITISQGLPQLLAHRSPSPLQPPGPLPQEAPELPPVLPLIPVSNPGLQLQREERGQGFFGYRHVR